MDNEDDFTDVPILTLGNVIVGAALAYSVYHLGRLGVALAKEGVNTLKPKLTCTK